VTTEPDVVTVPDALVGERVDRAVALLTGWSRGEAQALLARGAVLVDGVAPAKSARLRAGARLELLEEPEPAGHPTAEPVPIDVRAGVDSAPTMSLQARLCNGVVIELRGCDLAQAGELIEALGRLRCSASTKG